MKRRHKTLIMIIIGGVILSGAALIAFFTMKQTLSYFYAPSDVLKNPPKIGQSVRLGGLVENKSVQHLDNGVVKFIVTDGQANINVKYQGVLPDLFREGQGVIAEGSFINNDNFNAKNILAKHDENYVPKEVADSLKKSGQWRDANSYINEENKGK